ncbi:GntR family transcriptional regulator [Streptomyces sp. H27-G5]|uniref:GntR family transcriptional regulator n=1 Tax=Streptomyces sp. H27-G5 TaxID=2996698 RepID=UPI00226F39ED|nr:GntR family transcriptional regulator [Streptomyces sp. H27-G5]MCY0922861.1 GntR family transcriptional regulator [Streptomyces sp. H27-G5]
MSGKEPPKYKRIAERLRSAIEGNLLQPGDQLPSENALAREEDVSALTARAALKELKKSGLIESRVGAGIFVRQPFTPVRRHGNQMLAKERWGSSASIWSTDEDRDLAVDQLQVSEVAAPPRIAGILGLGEAETACLRSRRFVISGRPVLLSRSFLPQAVVTGSAITQPDTGAGGTYARLAELGQSPVRFREELRVRMPSAEEAELLELTPDSSVIQLVRTAWTADRRAVEVNDMVLDAEVYVLDYEFDA